MKPKRALTMLGVWLGLALAPTTAGAAPESEPIGSISGRVINVVTGQYLNNVRIVVRATKNVHFTDEFGSYRIPNLPSGSVALDFFYSGLAPRDITVEIRPGESVTRDMNLGGIDPADGSTVKLDPFVVASSRQMSAEMLAINEQRFAPNIKNVVATDAFGEIAEGNVAEFLKYVPGVTINYEDSQANTISIRGLPDHMVNVSLDGAQLAGSAGMTSDTRAFEFKQVGMSNISRIEVTKMPTPATPADSLSGSVNMITKSAFERSRPEFSYRAQLNANSENLTLQRTPDSFEDNTYKVLPGFDFTFQYPISKTLGFVLTGFSSNQFNEQHLSALGYSSANNDGSVANNTLLPRLQTYGVSDSPRRSHRNSASGKVDWRVTTNSVLTIGTQLGLYGSRVGEDRLDFNTGQNLAPRNVGGKRAEFGPDYSRGASERGLLTTAGSHWYLEGVTYAGNVSHRWDNGVWQTVAAVSKSISQSSNANLQQGRHPRQVWSRISNVGVHFLDINSTRPGKIQVFGPNDRELDWTNSDNYELYEMNDIKRNVTDAVESANVDIRRELTFAPFPLSFKAGAARSMQSRDRRNQSPVWSYGGPDGRTTTIDPPTPYVSQIKTQDIGFGFSDFPWPSVVRAWDAYLKNPVLFTKTAANLVAEETARIRGSVFAQETVTAWYLQGETRLLRSRLHLLGGFRHERSQVIGIGPSFDSEAVWVRSPDGKFAHTATGARIRRPEAGATGSLEELRLTRQERAYRGDRKYGDYYPSLHTTLNCTDNLLVRAAYAKTYGRPDYLEIIPNTTTREFDGVDPNTGSAYGTISVVNTGLKPWSAHNYDLSVEYYDNTGGVLSAGVFRKEISNFFGAQTRVATAADIEQIGLDDKYLGWSLTTKFNSGNATVSGAEFSVRQALDRFSPWTKGVTVFLNGTKLWLQSDAHEADFTKFIPEVLNWGFSFRQRRFGVMAKWNYRGRARNESTDFLKGFEGGYRYDEASTTLDVDGSFQLRRNLAIFATAKNLTNERRIRTQTGPAVPDYARAYQTRYYGVQFTLGIKGAF